MPYLPPNLFSIKQTITVPLVLDWYFTVGETVTATVELGDLGEPDVQTLDLMLAFVEAGTRFTSEFGDIDEPFYEGLELMPGCF